MLFSIFILIEKRYRHHICEFLSALLKSRRRTSHKLTERQLICLPNGEFRFLSPGRLLNVYFYSEFYGMLVLLHSHIEKLRLSKYLSRAAIALRTKGDE